MQKEGSFESSIGIYEVFLARVRAQWGHDLTSRDWSEITRMITTAQTVHRNLLIQAMHKTILFHISASCRKRRGLEKKGSIQLAADDRAAAMPSTLDLAAVTASNPSC
jgi:hypothetical protein